MSFISSAFAQVTEHASAAASAAPESTLLGNVIPFIMIFVIFYLFLIRPQQKKYNDHAALVNSVKRGDEIVTGGGIIAKVTKVQEDSNIVFVEISDGVEVRINKATIVEIISANDDAVKPAKNKKAK